MQLNQDIRNEINYLIKEKWEFINHDWPVINYKYKHRTELKHINEIENIKKLIIEKLGYTSVFFFLTILYSNKEYPGAYFEIEKGLFLLYHLISGNSGREINKYLPYSSFH